MVLLSEPAHQQRAHDLVSADCPVLIVSEAREQGKHSDAVPPTATAEDAAYIIFTSGSTGRPKGCILPHRGLQDMLPWLIEFYWLGKAGSHADPAALCWRC